jgi:peptidyl-prolyl cis-trans isomerase SurA
MLRPLACLFAIVSALSAGAISSQASQSDPAPGPAATSNRPAIGNRFANGIAAQVEDRVITVGDIRRKIEPILPGIMSAARDQKHLEQLIREAEDEVIQSLVDDVLIVKDFYSDEKRRIPDSYVDTEVETNLATEFDGDRAKFLAYLRSIGKTHLEYRELVREDMIVGYMKQQKRKTETMVSPVQIENYYTENRDQFFLDDGVHLRLIRLAAIAGESPAVLQQTADTIMAELRNGKDFGALAKEYSQDSRKNQGGDWGWIAKKDLRDELANAAFALNAGQFSEPIKLEKDIFILFVEEKRNAGIRAIDEVRDQIETRLVNQLGRAAIERYLERLRRDAYVRYFN